MTSCMSFQHEFGRCVLAVCHQDGGSFGSCSPILFFKAMPFSAHNVVALRETLGRSARTYVGGFEKGINALVPVTVEAMTGTEYTNLRLGVDDATAVRNKVFHSQFANRCLQREGLRDALEVVCEWCKPSSWAQSEWCSLMYLPDRPSSEGRRDCPRSSSLNWPA